MSAGPLGRAFIVALMSVAATLVAAPLAAPPAGVPVAACVAFPETGKQVCDRFLDYWQTHGGLGQQGLPLTDEFIEISPTDGRPYTVQYFERARFELHPERVPPYDVLLSLLGREQLLDKYPNGTPSGPPGSPTDADCLAFHETGMQVCGVFLGYWRANGGLAQQGLPLTGLFLENNPTDGRQYPTQYFERARFEYHAEHVGTPHVVLLGLLGWEQLQAEYPNGVPAAPTPSQLPGGANPSIRVGPGFSDVSPHQLVRTATGVLYAVVPTCDSYPACNGTALRVYKADRPGTPTGFAEQDAINRPPGAGTSAVALDGQERIHALWVDRAGRAAYAVFDTATDRWGAQEIVDITGWTDFGQGDQGAALALDAQGTPHAAWSARGGDGALQIRYAARGAEGWGTPMRADDVSLIPGHHAWHPTLAFAPDGALALAWLEGSFNYIPDGVVRVRVRAAAGGWPSSVALPDAAMTAIDNGPSLLVTPDGVRHLAFLDTGNAVRYWYDEGQGWRGDRQPARQVTHNPALGPDGAGGVYLYGHGTPQGDIGGHGDNLYRFRLPAGAAAWGPWALYAVGAFDSSVGTRWAQFFHHFPERVDILYWADPYPNILYAGTE